MENFNDLESLYKHLEEKALDYKYPHQIGNLFQKLRDSKHEENKLDEAGKAQSEIDFFNFVLKDGEIKPTFTRSNDKGEVVEYPGINRFDDKAYEYLIGRLDSTHNPLIKARYSQILWCSPKKHAKYAKNAVDSYLELIKIYEEKDKKSPQEHFGLDLLRAFENAYSLGHQINYKLEEIKSELKRLVIKFNFNSSSSFVLRATLIELMLKRKKTFLKEDFKGFEKICWRISKSLAKEENIHAAIDMLELGEKVDRKQEKKTHNWRKHVAKSYESLMKQAEEKDDSLVSLHFCQLAIENYKKLNDKGKIKELEKKYSELKNSIKLKEVKTEVDLTEHVKKCKEIAKKIAQNSSEGIIKILMLDKSILPKYKDMEKIVEEHSKIFITQYLFPTNIIDQRGHPVQHFSGEDEQKYFHVLQQYGWEIKLNKIHLINEIFFAAIRENKLSINSLLEFLNNHSWYGKDISKKMPNDKTIVYNWLNLLAPSLHEYFIQIQYYFLNAINYPNLVLSIDSLTLKIEGLLRDICQFSGVTTFYMTEDNKGRNIVMEKDIHALLYEEPIKTLFDEDDLLFFKFFLVEKAGYNLRHKIAHSLMLFEEYSIVYIHLLILALLRLGKYDFVKKEQQIFQ